MKNYYEILEVHPKASSEVIEKAYKVLVMKNHPDVVGEENSKIAEINEAYDILSNNFLRKQYDLELENNMLRNQNREYTESTMASNRKKNIRKSNNNQKIETETRPEVGTLGSMFEIVKLINPFGKERRLNREKKDFETVKKDRLALIITIFVVIILGVIAWFIPFTNQFMRELTVENPLFSWMFK